MHRGEASGDRWQHEPPVTLCERRAITQKCSEYRAHGEMPDCAAVHPPAPPCHGTSPPAAAPPTLLAPMIAQLWRLSPAPGRRKGGAEQRHHRRAAVCALLVVEEPPGHAFFAKSKSRGKFYLAKIPGRDSDSTSLLLGALQPVWHYPVRTRLLYGSTKYK